MVGSERVQRQPLRMFKLLVFGEGCYHSNSDRQSSKHEQRTMTCLFTAVVPARLQPYPLSPPVAACNSRHLPLSFLPIRVTHMFAGIWSVPRY